MPADFNKCIENGGRVRTISGEEPEDRKQFGIKKNQYIKICLIDGKMYRGKVHTKKGE